MSQNLVFATHAESDYSEHHGLEVCIAEVTKEQIQEIADLIQSEEYFESSYCTEYYNFPTLYHENGVFLEDCEFSMLQDSEEKSSDFFDELEWLNTDDGGDESRVKPVRNSVVIPEKGCFIVTCKSQSTYLYAEGEVSDDWSGPLTVLASDFHYGKKHKDSLGFGLLTSVQAEGSAWIRGASESEEADDELSGMHQLIIADGKVVLYAKTADDSLFDADDLGLEAVLDTWYEDTESVLAGLKAVTK
jgi:hypothetical protein